MRGPKPEALSLSEVERTELERFVRRHSTPQQLTLRGRIILAADAGKNNSQIAREEAVSVDTVRSWRRRWLALRGITREDLSIGERLSDEARPGRRSQITAAFLSDPTHKVVFHYTLSTVRGRTRSKSGEVTWYASSSNVARSPLLRTCRPRSLLITRLLQSHDGQTFQVDLPGQGVDYLNALPDFCPNEWQGARLA